MGFFSFFFFSATFPYAHLLWVNRFRILTLADQGNISYLLAAFRRLVMVVYWAEAYR